jgi:hypothetical protein
MYVAWILYSLLSRPTNAQHIFINNILYIPEDDAYALKHLGVLMIYKILINICCAFVGLDNKIQMSTNIDTPLHVRWWPRIYIFNWLKITCVSNKKCNVTFYEVCTFQYGFCSGKFALPWCTLSDNLGKQIQI